jgi:hypothetical protein
MGFPTEPTSYEKTALSDLQGAWISLRDTVVDNFGFPDSDKLLFHIDEAMSWESVRNLNRMKSTLLLVQNIISQSDVPEEIVECFVAVRDSMEEVLSAMAEGEKF